MQVVRILLVDDFLPWQRFILNDFESIPDLEIVGLACDGLEAVQKAKDLLPDLILLDVSLPWMNGFEAARQIRTLSPNSKILFLSEHRGADLVQAAFEAGGSGYVLKSDAGSDLVEGVRAVLLNQRFLSRNLKNLPDLAGTWE